MTAAPRSRSESLFASVVRRRWWIVAVYALLLPGALAVALRIPRDNALERMVVATNPDVVATRDFQRVFPETPMAMLVAHTAEPYSAAALDDLAALTAHLERVPKVVTYSVLTAWERLHPGATARPEHRAELRRFVAGTDFFRAQGLAGEDFWGVVVALDVAGPEERDVALAGIDAAIAQTLAARPAASGQVTRVGRVGAPWLDSWLEHETAAATVRFFPLFGAFVVVLILGLYRSWRALAAILVSLGVAVLLGVALGGLLGFGFTIVSSLVPLTLMVTATASLVYLHSRFVDRADGADLEAHRRFALRNKLLAVSASVFATAVGFAALAVSEIRPIRELGIWTAGGLAIGWVVCFSLYPALQVIVRAPTRQQRGVSGGWVTRAADVIPRWSYRRRWPILAVALALALAGLVALVGIPGQIAPLRLELDALDYVDPGLPAARDTRDFAEHVLGLTAVSLVVTTPSGTVLEPATLAALDRLSSELAAEPAVGSVVGLPAVLRLRRYAAGQGDTLPRDEAELAAVAADLEQLVLVEPTLRQWVDTASLSATYLSVTSRAGSPVELPALSAGVAAAWQRAVAASPALAPCSYRLVGSGVLQASIAAHLVPTLVHSFSLTFAIIFVTFVLVFRSGPARLTAMAPSLFAILVMFLFMRLTGIPLNVATILIATTVLGATENDQIHFFYHFQERRRLQEGRGAASTEQALAHAIRVAGHPILFATLINAGGFLALSLSNLPPMRQFGTVTSAAFVLAMLADFTVLPAALWLLFRERPDAPPA